MDGKTFRKGIVLRREWKKGQQVHVRNEGMTMVKSWVMMIYGTDGSVNVPVWLHYAEASDGVDNIVLIIRRYNVRFSVYRRVVLFTSFFVVTVWLLHIVSPQHNRWILQQEAHTTVYTVITVSLLSTTISRVVHFPEISGNISKSLEVMTSIILIRIRWYSWEPW